MTKFYLDFEKDVFNVTVVSECFAKEEMDDFMKILFDYSPVHFYSMPVLLDLTQVDDISLQTVRNLIAVRETLGFIESINFHTLEVVYPDYFISLIKTVPSLYFELFQCKN